MLSTVIAEYCEAYRPGALDLGTWGNLLIPSAPYFIHLNNGDNSFDYISGLL